VYDVGLSLRMSGRAIGNDVEADGRSLVMITGANQGGKSTFLRSVGIAQVMMQCGLFVGADQFRADVREVLFTHFKRREDPTMVSGKLDEELKRFSDIADHLTRNSLLLFNESFAATNEREGADIAEEIVRALLEAGDKILFVTHSYELARRFLEGRRANVLFVRAERLPDGRRTFRQREGEPLATSYGQDLFRRIFASGSSAGGIGPS
jgi:DNA mismatch repair ATPase MutS